MNINLSTGDKLFNPLVPLLLYLFMAITTLHIEIPLLLNLHIESITLIAVLVNTLLYITLSDKLKLNFDHPIMLPLLIGLLFIISPLITSLFNHGVLLILKNQEYQDLFKMIIFSSLVFFFLQKKEFKNKILNSIIVFYFIFGLYFLYRFLVLHEVREYDQRPLLKIRHGDANFICTFFSMMFPLALMQAWYYKNKKTYINSIIFTLISIFFFICAFLTESRMGIIAIIIGLLYLASKPLITSLNKMRIGFFLSIIAITFVINSDHLFQRYADIQDKSNEDRYLTWKNGLQVFKDNPIIGAGIHSSPSFFYKNTQYPHFQSEFKPLEVHNAFIKVAAELGIIGLFSFILLYFWPYIKSLQLISEDRVFLICSMGILTLSIMTIGIVYKDLFILHLFIIAALAKQQKLKTT